MLSWQRRLRIALGLFILVFAVGLFVALRHPSRPLVTAPATQKTDPQAVVQSAKGTLLLSKGAKQDVRTDYDMLFTYADGTSKLVGVSARLPERSGRDFTIKAREAKVNSDQSDMSLTGAVHIEASDGLILDTEAASYRKDQSVVTAPGAVTFTRGRMTGSGVGMTYEQNNEVLTFLDKAVIHIRPDEKGQGAADVESGLAALARRDKYIRFERGVKIVRDGQTTTADQAIAYLTEDEKDVKMIALRGSSRVDGAGNASGGLKAMTARDIDLYYGAEGQKLDHATLKGGSLIELSGTTAATGRRLAGDDMDIWLAPDGTTVTGLSAREHVQLDLPPENGTPARVIRAVWLQASGEAGKGLTAAVFKGGSGQVEFRETPAPPASARVARSRVLELAMQGGFTTIDSARFTEGARFEEGDMAAVAREARYVLSKGVLNLAGNDDKTGQRPRVIDEQATIEANKIDIGLDGRKIAATGTVKSDLRPRKASAPAKPANGRANGKGQAAEKTQTRLPAMLKQDQPVSATSDNLEYEGAASHAIYTGKARLWQGDTTIKGDRITLDDQKGDLTASGNVVTNMLLEQVNDKTKAKEQVRSVASARDMVYKDDVRRATYTGTAHLNSPQGDLTADKIELYLKESGNEVDRLEAYTAVKFKTPEGRTATGARLTYFSADERYVMHGTPVKIVEECRESTGKILTFFRSADRIIVDGNEQKRTETKGASACGSGPRSSD